MNVLNFHCPHCQHEYNDELEVLHEGELHHFNCEACAKQFVVLIKECLKCAAETVTVWPDTPTWEEVAVVACSSCGSSFVAPEDLEEDI
jgi:transcription elongation factor Elf1